MGRESTWTRRVGLRGLGRHRVSRAPRQGVSSRHYLAEYFDTIEINTSFYHPMKAEHARQWIERVAGNPRFLFTAKLWQKFTHEDHTDRKTRKSRGRVSTSCAMRTS